MTEVEWVNAIGENREMISAGVKKKKNINE